MEIARATLLPDRYMILTYQSCFPPNTYAIFKGNLKGIGTTFKTDYGDAKATLAIYNSFSDF